MEVYFQSDYYNKSFHLLIMFTIAFAFPPLTFD